MSHQSDKHGPRQDDELAQEVRGQVQSDADRLTVPADRRGNPAGMDTADVEARSELARFLGRHVYPADREQLLQIAAQNSAPDVVLRALASLPADLKFDNVADVASELGLAQERRRF